MFKETSKKLSKNSKERFKLPTATQTENRKLQASNFCKTQVQATTAIARRAEVRPVLRTGARLGRGESMDRLKLKLRGVGFVGVVAQLDVLDGVGVLVGGDEAEVLEDVVLL